MNTDTSAIIPSYDSSSRTILTKQNDEDDEDMSDNYHIVMTIL